MPAHMNTQITLTIKQTKITKDGKDDTDNFSCSEQIPRQDSDATAGYHGTWVILVGGLLPTSTLSLHIPTLVYKCLSTNPPITIYPWLHHSS